MLFAAVTFIGVVVLVVGIYWVMLERPEMREQGELLKRLRVGAGSLKGAKRIDFVKQAEKLSAVKSLDAVLARTSVVTGSLQRLIAQADVKMTVGSLLLASACLFLGAWLIVGRITRLPWLGFAVGALLAYVPYLFVKFKAKQRLRTFEEQFPEAIDLIARALRAGHAFTSGLAIVAEEAPQPVAGEFRVLYDQQNFGMPLGDAMKAFAERLPLLDARFFVTAVLTQRESGGNLAEILGNLANVIRERFKVKRQVRVISAHGRITGWVLSGLPPSLAMAFLITSPNHIMTLVNDPLGVQMIFGALFLQIIGTLIIRKLVNIEY
jgi:tight adherence protein B